MHRRILFPCTALALSSFSMQPNRATCEKLHQKTVLKDKVVIVTGATAGIGKAIAWRFAHEGAKLVLIGRRENLLDSLKGDISLEYPNVKVHTIAMSVTDLEKVKDLPVTLPEEYQDVDILVNNAGLALGVASVDENDMKDAETVLNTNVLSIIALCRAFVPGMKIRGSGHIINIGSIAGHVTYTQGTTYNASKYAVVGFTNAARHDLVGTPIRVTMISPGLCSNTEFSNVRLKDDTKAKSVYADIEALHPEDVADNVIYAATRPKHVQIADIIVLATNQSGPRDIARVGPSLGFNGNASGK